ncbi:trypsin-like peptidase domain-containing protein [Pseudonocardia xinjiangensis]|uniref:nSTAND1 domain-containing NTPase n=1 Tax=Pseudonocardia xinjiangensis TaxID=75289 RepID=UPI003D8F94E9
MSFAAGLDSSILAVCDTEGSPAGVAFLVTDGLAVTCAHVVAQVHPTPVAEGDVVELRHAVPTAGRARYPAEIVRLLPAEPDGTGDIAVLRLTGGAGAGTAVRLVDAADVWGHPARTFGFPARRDNGVWHEGVLRGRQGAGWIQVDRTGAAGYPIEPGFSGAPLWDDELGGVVGMVVAADTTAGPAGYVIPAAWLVEAWPELRRTLIPPPPYRGLLPFREADRELFFGREKEAAKLVDDLYAASVLTIVGPSGSGKSSLVQAGAMPRMRSRGAAVALLRAGNGSEPLSALGAALVPLIEPELTRIEQLDAQTLLTARIAERGLADVLAQVLDTQEHRSLVIVVDQAEQLLGLAAESVDPLFDALFTGPGAEQLRVLMALRADFLDAALKHPRLGEQLTRGTFLLAGMTEHQVRQAVAAPVERIPGVQFEPGLVDVIVREAGTDPGSLPLLGNTLAELWRRQHRGMLTHRAYDEMGRLSGSLAQHAEQTWNEISAGQRDTARRLFLSLVQVTANGSLLSRRAATAEQLGEDAWPLAQRLATARLLVAGHDAENRPTVRLAHDALIEHWQRLRTWAEADREFRLWLEEVGADRDRWQRADRASELLLRGEPLRAARSWLTSRPDDVDPLRREYVERSARGALTYKSRRRRQVITLVTVTVAALIASVLVVVRDRAARIEQSLASSRAFAAAATAMAERDTGRSLLLALAAYRESPSDEAHRALFGGYVRTLNADTVFSGWAGSGLTDVDASDDGSVVVALSSEGDYSFLTLWHRDPHGGRATRSELSADGGARKVVVVENGQALVVGGDRGLSRIDVASGRRQALDGPARQAIRSFAVTPDGSVAAVLLNADGRSRVEVWDLAAGRLIGGRLVEAGTHQVGGPRLAPDARSVVVDHAVGGRPAGGGARRVEVWDATTGEVRVLDDSADRVFVSKQNVLVTCRIAEGTGRYAARLVADGREIGRAEGDLCQDFVTDGPGTTVMSGLGGTRRIVDLTLGRPTGAVLEGAESTLTFAVSTNAIDDDVVETAGHTLALVSGPEEIRAVRLSPNAVTDALRPTLGGTNLTSDGRYILSQSAGRVLRVADARTGEIVSEAHQSPAPGPAFTPWTELGHVGALVAQQISAYQVTVYTVPDLRVVSEITAAPIGGEARLEQMWFDTGGSLLTRVGSRVTCWDPVTGAATCETDLHGADGPAGRALLMGSSTRPDEVTVVDEGSSVIRWVDIRTGDERRRLDVGPGVTVASAPWNDQHVVVGRNLEGGGAVVEMWDAVERRIVAGPTTDRLDWYDLAALDEPGQLLVGAFDRLELWHAGETAPVRTFDLSGWQMFDATADGSRIGVMDGVDLAATLELDPEMWAGHVCRVTAGRVLEPAELAGLPPPTNPRPLCP